MSAVTRSVRTVTIANGQTVSNGIDLSEMVVNGIQFPTMTGTSFTFQASSDGVTYGPVKKLDGTAYTVVAVSLDFTVIAPADLAGIRYIRIVSNGAEAAARDVLLIVRNV